MDIAVFTSCQPRHIALLERLAAIADTVYACIEVNTLFPGQTDDFFRASDVMQSYFAQVQAAEFAEFGSHRFLPATVQVLPMKSGDLNGLDLASLKPALDADLTVVFGSSYIKSPLIDPLVERGAFNIHMGTSPYYRGSSCNFWALYDSNPGYVGATIHMLSKGLDSGPMLCHALPVFKTGERLDGFALGMRAVQSAFNVVVELISSQRWKEVELVNQDRSRKLRYSRNSDFTDAVAGEYLRRVKDMSYSAEDMGNQSPFILL
jgi:hypothetical protein